MFLKKWSFIFSTFTLLILLQGKSALSASLDADPFGTLARVIETPPSLRARWNALFSLPSLAEGPARDESPPYLERPLGPLVPLHLAEDIAAGRFPRQFIGRRRFQPELIKGLRSLFQSQGEDIAVFRPTDLFESTINRLLSVLDKIPMSSLKDHGPEAHTLAHELRTYKAVGGSMFDMPSCCLRTAKVLSHPSTEEEDFFRHTIHPEIFLGLLHKNFLGHGLEPFACMATALDTQPELVNKESPRSIGLLDFGTAEALQKALRNKIPAHMLDIQPGIGKFGLTFLVRQYLSGIRPAGLPIKNCPPAHGIPLSPAGFLIHDWLHNIVAESWQEGAEDHLIKMANRYLKEGGSLKDFDLFIPFAAQRYTQLMNSFYDLSTLFLARLLPYDSTLFHKVMVGFFWAIHEFSSSSSKPFFTDDLNSILAELVDSTQGALKRKEGWESSHDPFNTSPLDGKSLLSEDEMKKIFFPDFYNDPTLYIVETDEKKRQQKAIDLLEDVTVRSSPFFHDVLFRRRFGQVHTFSSATLYYKWHNMDDSLALLKMAGIHIPKPELPKDREEARKIAQETLDDVQKELSKCIDCFGYWGSFFINYEGDGNLSLQEKFAESYGAEVAIKRKLKERREERKKTRQSFDFLLS